MVLLYGLSVVFCLFMSWVFWSFERSLGAVNHTWKDKTVHVVMPFIPFMNLAWVFLRLL